VPLQQSDIGYITGCNSGNILVEVAIIAACSRARDLIFGRSLLERLILICQRAGAKSFYILAPEDERRELRASLRLFQHSFDIIFIESPSEVISHVPDSALCVALRGNLVFGAMEPL
jgi:hypothetical protein